jgi:NAD(P)H-dependent FMN reductase
MHTSDEPEADAHSKLKIAIIVGSIRTGRKGSQVGRWVADLAAQRTDAYFSLMELADYDVPLLTAETVPGGANRQYESAAVRNWSRDIDSCDAFIFVTPEYNHGVPGAFKNAFDSLGPEWGGKAVGFVAYGSVGGVRAVEQWRQIVATFGMTDVTAEITMPTYSEFDREGTFTPSERRQDELGALIDEVVLRTRA